MTFKRAYKTHKINIHTPKINRSKKGNIYLDSQKNNKITHSVTAHTHKKDDKKIVCTKDTKIVLCTHDSIQAHNAHM